MTRARDRANQLNVSLRTQTQRQMEDESGIESSIGPNAPYYMKHFRAFAAEGRRYYDANMTAALWSYVWVAYRRTYRWLPVVALIELASIG